MISYFSVSVAQTSDANGVIENLMLALPVPVFLVGFFTLHDEPRATRFPLAISTTMFAFILAIPLVLTLGAWFRISFMEPGAPF